MSDDKSLPFFLTQSRGLKTAVAADDFLHPAVNSEVQDDSLTETQYFGICCPEERIHGLLYLWHHPNLKTVSGGVWVWQGNKPLAIECEMFDWRSFMSDRILANDLHGFKMASSYAVEVIEPLKRHHVSYSDPERGNMLDLNYQALAPPVVWADGRHFEQAMRVRGKISLAGVPYEINGYNVRDRSWGKPRPEALFKMPPVAWLTGVFDDDFHFNCTATDHPDLRPDWHEIFPEFPQERTLMGGWIRRDGELTELASCRKRTIRNLRTLQAERIELSMVDVKGRVYELTGETIATSALVGWQNVLINVALTRWTYGKLVGHGDSQESIMHDFVRGFRKRHPWTQ